MNNPFAQQGPQQPSNPFGGPPQAPQQPAQAPQQGFGQQQPGNPFGGAQGPSQPASPPAPPAQQGQPSKSIDDVLSGGKTPGAFVKTDPVGTVRQGTIINHEIRQIRDPETNKLKTWDDGNPQEQIVIRIQTTMQDSAEDDGVRGIFVKMWGPNLDNLKQAIRDTGVDKPSQALAPGNVLSAQFAEERPTRGFPEKVYRYHIQPSQPGQQSQPPQQPQQPNPAMQVAQNRGWNQQEEPPF